VELIYRSNHCQNNIQHDNRLTKLYKLKVCLSFGLGA